MYYPYTSFVQAKVGNGCSFTWRSILGARYILKEGCTWRVGNGQSIDIWEDRWLNHPDHSKVFTASPQEGAVHYVSDLIDQDKRVWNLEVLRYLFLPIDIPYIISTPLSRRSVVDCII